MRTWRLCQARFADSAFDGSGAQRYGGRWHWPGTPVVYTASSLSLAALEALVHFDQDLTPAHFVAFDVGIPSRLRLRRITPAQLPPDWRAAPPADATRDIGTHWIRSCGTVGLIVPSALVPHEHNVLLNPRHPDFAHIRIGTPEPFAFDPRLLRE